MNDTESECESVSGAVMVDNDHKDKDLSKGRHKRKSTTVLGPCSVVSPRLLGKVSLLVVVAVAFFVSVIGSQIRRDLTRKPLELVRLSVRTYVRPYLRPSDFFADFAAEFAANVPH